MCSGFPSLLMSCNKIVCSDQSIAVFNAPKLLPTDLVCAASNQEGLSTWIKSDGQYLLVVCLQR